MDLWARVKATYPGEIDMQLFEYHAHLPHPIEDVFALTVDLESAPRWHSFFRDVRQLTDYPIGIGSQWQMIFNAGSFVLTIIDYQPPHRVVFEGSQIMGMIPNFTIYLQPESDGTRVNYQLHPDVPLWMRLPVAIFAPPYGRWDLKRYFAELDQMMN